MWDDEISVVMKAQLLRAYVRRKEWEARLVAVQVMNALGGAMQKGQEPREVGIGELMQRMGGR